MAVAARPPVLPVFIDEQYRPEGALRQTLRIIECASARVGDGAHAEHEHVVTATMPDRARLLARLVGALQ